MSPDPGRFHPSHMTRQSTVETPTINDIGPDNQSECSSVVESSNQNSQPNTDTLRTRVISIRVPEKKWPVGIARKHQRQGGIARTPLTFSRLARSSRMEGQVGRSGRATQAYDLHFHQRSSQQNAPDTLPSSFPLVQLIHRRTSHHTHDE